MSFLMFKCYFFTQNSNNDYLSVTLKKFQFYRLYSDTQKWKARLFKLASYILNEIISKPHQKVLSHIYIKIFSKQVYKSLKSKQALILCSMSSISIASKEPLLPKKLNNNIRMSLLQFQIPKTETCLSFIT